MRIHATYRSIIVCAFILSCTSCRHADKKITGDTPIKMEKSSKKQKKIAADNPAQRAPIINIADTITPKQIILFVRDSAASSDGISQKLSELYNVTLPGIIKKNQLIATGPPAAWYNAQKAPFFFEAGIPVDKKPAALPKGFFIKNIGGDSAVVAHFFGPYNRITIAYETLNDFLKSAGRKRSQPAYEIYVGDGKVKDGKNPDPYKVQTDIVFPFKKL